MIEPRTLPSRWTARTGSASGASVDPAASGFDRGGEFRGRTAGDSPCLRSPERPFSLYSRPDPAGAARDRAARWRPPSPASQVRVAGEPVAAGRTGESGPPRPQTSSSRPVHGAATATLVWTPQPHRERAGALTRGSRTVVRLRLTHWPACGQRRWSACSRTAPSRRADAVASRARRHGPGCPPARSSVKSSKWRASTDPEATMIYALPQLQKHDVAIGRPEGADRAPASVPHPIRLAETAGRVFGGSVSY